jgi:Ca2+-binding RTX toxin-like protein
LNVDQLEDRVTPSNSVTIVESLPATLFEGVAVDLSSTVDGAVEVVAPATYSWEVLKDGVSFATGSLADFSFTPDDDGVYAVSLSVTDDDNTHTDNLGPLTVVNQAPVAGVSGPTTGLSGQLLTFTLTATDADADETEGFDYSIDWNNDGTPDETVTASSGNGAGVTVSHAFTQPGPNTFSVTATDKDDATSAKVTHTVTLELGAAVVDGVLIVSGSSGNDVIKFVPKGKSRAQNATMKVFINGVNQGIFTGVNSIKVYALAGNDFVHLAGSIKTSATVLGDAGDDRIKGGKGADMLVGGEGNDWLNGHQGRDVLIGGNGVDRLLGGPGDDILIGGATSYDADEAALASLLAIWSGSGGYSQRVATLADAAAAVHLTSGTGGTVLDDGVADRLTGGAGKDWFLATVGSDAVTGRHSFEFLNETKGNDKGKGGGKGKGKP